MANVVLPKVRLFIPCFSVLLEKGKATSIISPFHTVRMPPGVGKAFRVQELWLYLQLSDGVGKFNLSIQLLNEEGIIIGVNKPVTVDFPGTQQLQVREFRLLMRNALFPSPGIYEFKLVANHATFDGRGTSLLRVLGG